MAGKGRVTEGEREYIRSKIGQLSVTKIAKNLGRSRSIVSKIVSDEGLRKKAVETASTEPAPGGAPPPGPADTLGRLKELRDMLRDALKVAQPRETAALAREYRATVEAIDRMEGDPDDPKAIAIDEIGASIARSLSA